jgi:cytochrome c-type protein NapB
MRGRLKIRHLGLGALVMIGAAVAVWWFFLRGGTAAATPSRFAVRAARRAYDGAPPVIPHRPFGGACTTCHAERARELPGEGVAPPNPHLHTAGMSAASRCQQCHVFKDSDDQHVASTFTGLRQVPRHGDRLYPHAPPVIPHATFMRESCLSCHDGPAARAEIRCTHPERTRCVQCHAARELPPFSRK